MTADEIRALPAGREMDALVAVRVFGWQWWRSGVTNRRAVFLAVSRPSWFQEDAAGDEPLAAQWDTQLPNYSTDIAAAWLVAEWLRERWGQFTLVAGLEWHCFPSEESRGDVWGTGETPMLAICRAALLELAD